MGQYDFNSLYGQADSSIFVYDAGVVDAVVESSTWGKTKDGTKGQWDVRLRVTTGPNAGRVALRKYMTVTTDGPSAAQSLGIMFRQFEAMGIPEQWVKTNPPEEQIAQAMVGKPVLIKITVEEFEGVSRNKVSDIRPPRPGAPTTWPQFQQPQAPAAMPGYGQQPYGAAPQYQPQGQFQSMQPGYGQAPAPYAQPQQDYSQPSYAPPQQPDPWATPGPQGGPQAPQQPPVNPWDAPQAVPAANGTQQGVPPWAQPQMPEQQPWNPMQQQPIPGPQAAPAPYPQQAPQPGYGAAPAPFQQPQPQQPQQGPAPAAPVPTAPWNGQGGPAQAQPDQQGGPQGAPQPPWAQ
jgi:hypothetical protein